MIPDHKLEKLYLLHYVQYAFSKNECATSVGLAPERSEGDNHTCERIIFVRVSNIIFSHSMRKVSTLRTLAFASAQENDILRTSC